MTTDITPTARRPPLITPALLLLFAANIGSATSFYLLLSVVPRYAAGTNLAGILTATLMLATVIGELAVPRLTATFGHRRVLTIGLLLLGAPALLLTIPNTAVVIAVCLIRGLGFAITVVIGGALSATLIPAERRGEGLGISGIVAGIPAVIALPAGLALAAHLGPNPVYIAGAIAALAAIAAVPGLPNQHSGTVHTETGMLSALRTTALRRPAMVFAVTAMAAGITVTFLPLATGHTGAATAAIALLAQSSAMSLARWIAGRHGDRHGPATQLIPALATTAAGIALLAIGNSPTLIIGGALLFGIGFGIAQNATLTLMFARVPTTGYGAASALWNLGYDGGMGVGAAGFGIVAAHTGLHTAFALTALAVVAFVVPARRDRVAQPVQSAELQLSLK
jgi:MFS family permease